MLIGKRVKPRHTCGEYDIMFEGVYDEIYYGVTTKDWVYVDIQIWLSLINNVSALLDDSEL